MKPTSNNLCSSKLAIVKLTTAEAVDRGNIDFFQSLDQLKTFIALRYARGLYEKSYPVLFLWNKRYGIPLLFKIMSRNKFTKILKYLGFDDKPNRVRSGSAPDKLVSIRDVFNTFSSMCQSKYICNISLTVDEQLMPLKSHCAFITFMPNKPHKYDKKFRVFVDVKSNYVANITPY